jgi:hypothetical protein
VRWIKHFARMMGIAALDPSYVVHNL